MYWFVSVVRMIRMDSSEAETGSRKCKRSSNHRLRHLFVAPESRNLGGEGGGDGEHAEHEAPLLALRQPRLLTSTELCGFR